MSDAALADGTNKRRGITAKEANRGSRCEFMAREFPVTLVIALSSTMLLCSQIDAADSNRGIGVPRELE